jgi:hypothetical protein
VARVRRANGRWFGQVGRTKMRVQIERVRRNDPNLTALE